MALTVKVDSETVFGIGCVQRLPFKTSHVDVLVQAEIHHGVLLQHIAHVIQLGRTYNAVRIVFRAITGRIAVSLVMNRLYQTSEQVLNLLVVIVLCGIGLCRLFADNLRCLHIQTKAARRSDFLIHSSNLFGQGSIDLFALCHTVLCQMGGQQQRIRSGSGRCLLRQFCQTSAETFIEDILACDNLLAHAYIRFQYRHTGSRVLFAVYHPQVSCIVRLIFCQITLQGNVQFAVGHQSVDPLAIVVRANETSSNVATARGGLFLIIGRIVRRSDHIVHHQLRTTVGTEVVQTKFVQSVGHVLTRLGDFIFAVLGMHDGHVRRANHNSVYEGGTRVLLDVPFLEP